MTVNFLTYRMLDDPTAKDKPCIFTPLNECREWNEKGYGIFWTLNEFKNKRRVIDNLVKINTWAIDIDSGTKESQIEKIKKGLVPSLIVETKRGHHVYFMAKDADPKYFKHIMIDRLIPFYDGDKRAKDVCRILRVPEYYHCKDLNNKYLIKKIWERKVYYTQDVIAAFYPDVNLETRKRFDEQTREVRNHIGTSDDLWREVYDMDAMNALERLSGNKVANGEVFTFRKNANGNYNIFVDGKSTSCFIDTKMKIGSADGGGPTIFSWINWYLKNPKKTVEVMKKIYPELPWKN